jgi:hypothetical protein
MLVAKMSRRARSVAQGVECLFSKHKVLSSNPISTTTTKTKQKNSEGKMHGMGEDILSSFRVSERQVLCCFMAGELGPREGERARPCPRLHGLVTHENWALFPFRYVISSLGASLTQDI